MHGALRTLHVSLNNAFTRIVCKLFSVERFYEHTLAKIIGGFILARSEFLKV